VRSIPNASPQRRRSAGHSWRKRGPAVRKITACGAPRGARRVRQRMRNHRICAFRRATPFGGLLILRRAEGPSRRMRDKSANPGCCKGIAATKEHALLVETQQQTPYLPLAGRSARACAPGGGNCIARPLCCPSAMPPPQRRAFRAPPDLPARGRYAATVEAMKIIPRRSSKLPALPLWESTTARSAQSVRGQRRTRAAWKPRRGSKLSCPRRRASSSPGRQRLLDRPVKPGDDRKE
jgi:hypothetical protein